MPQYDLHPSLAEVGRILKSLETAPDDSSWRAAAQQAAPLFLRASATLLETLARPPASNILQGRRELLAQRFARTKVAELQLYHADAVQAGRASGDLYAALQPQIDAARAQFREQFLTNPDRPADSLNGRMTDYLHTEIRRALANDDAKLLGANYPGPLA
jgi:hypothetical protein